MQVKVKMKGPVLAREKALESRSMLAQGKASLLTERLADRPAGQDLSCQDLSCQDLLEQ